VLLTEGEIGNFPAQQPKPASRQEPKAGDVGTALSKITKPGRLSFEQVFIWGMSAQTALDSRNTL